MLYDQHGRRMNYMRVAVTDRCNLRCSYCMPECGIDFTSRAQLLSFEEILRITKILTIEGVNKIRITGGEPFVRRDLDLFLRELKKIEGVEQIHITTNGTLIQKHIETLDELGIRSINLSLDSLDRNKFFQITKRDELPIVIENMHEMLKRDFTLKINMVVMSNYNVDDIIPMIELTRSLPIEVRFLEEMPFNGQTESNESKPWTHVDILNRIHDHYPDYKQLKPRPNSTSVNYQIPNFSGRFGIIAAWSRTFCGTCNRIRLTPEGMLRTCLYDDGTFQLRDFMRQGASDEQILSAVKEALKHRAVDGHEAEAKRSTRNISESMASIGG